MADGLLGIPNPITAQSWGTRPDLPSDAPQLQASSLLDLMDAPLPPPNQGVLDFIARRKAATANMPEAGFDLMSPIFAGAQTPGHSGYFELDASGSGRGIVPKMMAPQEMAQAQIGPGVLPSGVMGQVGYNIPNDRGGFFTVQDVFRPRGGLPIGGAAEIGQNLPSTNNWRLLGMGPGWIMRNGKLINTRSPGVGWGFGGGGVPGFGNTAEQAVPGAKPFVGPGNALTGANEWGAKYWPGAEQWTSGFQQAYTG